MTRTNNKLNARLESNLGNIGGSQRSYRRWAITTLHIHCFIENAKETASCNYQLTLDVVFI